MFDKWSRTTETVLRLCAAVFSLYLIIRTVVAAVSEKYPEATFFLLAVFCLNYLERDLRTKSN
jgi:hypothetical protein